MDKVVTWRRGGYSRRVNLSTWWRLAAALVLTVLVMLGSLSLGKVILSPLEVIRILFSTQDASLTLIVEQLRFPRIVLAALVGAALSVSGLILQSIIRNPLASPDLLGITSGASAAAVLYLSFLSATLGQQFLPLAAMLGAALATLAIYLLAWKQGTSPLRLVLIGVGVSAMFDGQPLAHHVRHQKTDKTNAARLCAARCDSPAVGGYAVAGCDPASGGAGGGDDGAVRRAVFHYVGPAWRSLWIRW